MKAVIFCIVALLTLTGFHSEEIHVEEDGLIPDSSLLDAYAYRDACIPEKFIELEGRYETLAERKVISNAACDEEMFVLFSKSKFTVTATNLFGGIRTIHTDTTIEGVNEFLNI